MSSSRSRGNQSRRSRSRSPCTWMSPAGSRARTEPGWWILRRRTTAGRSSHWSSARSARASGRSAMETSTEGLTRSATTAKKKKKSGQGPRCLTVIRRVRARSPATPAARSPSYRDRSPPPPGRRDSRVGGRVQEDRRRVGVERIDRLAVEPGCLVLPACGWLAGAARRRLGWRMPVVDRPNRPGSTGRPAHAGSARPATRRCSCRIARPQLLLEHREIHRRDRHGGAEPPPHRLQRDGELAAGRAGAGHQDVEGEGRLPRRWSR